MRSRRAGVPLLLVGLLACALLCASARVAAAAAVKAAGAAPPENVDGAGEGAHGDGHNAALEREADAYCRNLNVAYNERHDNPCECGSWGCAGRW